MCRKGLLVLLLTLASAGVWGSSGPTAFDKPPETFWPYGEPPYNNPWITPAPYQRNIIYTFDNGLDIFKAQYWGTDDPALWESDCVVVSPNVQWYASDPFAGSGRQGLLGFLNTGNESEDVWIRFRIDNHKSPNPWKHIWKEVIFGTPAGLASWDVLEWVELPDDNYSIYTGMILLPVDNLPNGFYRENAAWKVTPNPPWEEVVISVSVLPGEWVLLDQIHFATECIPEPGTVALLGTGVFVLVGLIRRRRMR